MSNVDRANRYARFIPSEEIARVAEWRFGAVDETVRAAVALAARHEAVEAAENSPSALQKMQEVRDAAHAAGVAEGRAAATLELRQQMDDYVAGTGRERGERFNGLLDSVGQALEKTQQRIAESVIEIACDVARQVLRRELQVDAQAAMPAVREALAMVRADGRVAIVRLDPEDLEQLRATLSDEEMSGQPVTWLADESVGPGGCQVESAGSVVDGRLSTRWKRAVAALGCEAPWDSAGDPEPLLDKKNLGLDAGDAVQPDADTVADLSPGDDVGSAQHQPADDPDQVLNLSVASVASVARSREFLEPAAERAHG